MSDERRGERGGSRATRGSASERPRSERESGLKRARVRKRALIGGCAALAVAFAAGLGIATGTATGTSSAEETAHRPLKIPAHSQGTDGTLIAYGPGDAKTTLEVYEDPRCPYCGEFERKLGPTLKKMAESGTVRIEFHLAAFLDKSLGGHGSTTALAALGAALDQSPEKFTAFHDVLFSHQPAKETDDAFASTAHLLELAGKVPGLRTPAFNKAVKEKTYAPWADKVADAFYDSDVTGTPTVKADDKKLTVIDADGKAVSPKDFTRQIAAAADGA
ncbi:DsbA family protein [Streptomyces sp. SYP-A7185]|uniref:DsbA family protein n=1 Tax=Streptomyces sp. SYP-A7185 TaxID=3040076 RepID=UPI0038F7FEBC